MRRLHALLLLAMLAAPASAHDRSPGGGGLPRGIGERDPSESGAQVPRTTYQSVTAATKTYRPVAPLPWDELNRRVTPQPKQEAPAKK